MPVAPGYGPPRVGGPRPGGKRPDVWVIGGLPPPVTIIPWTWLSAPIQFRPDQPINSVSVTRVNQAAVTVPAASAGTSASQATYGLFAAATTLDTISTDDATNLATFLTTYYANPLMRAPKLTLSLVYRTDAERQVILGVTIGSRITLGPGTVQDAPGHTIVLPVPSTLPPGVLSLVVEGIRTESSVTDRITEWTTAPLLGASPGTEGTWFRIDTSVLGGTDVIPF